MCFRSEKSAQEEFPFLYILQNCSCVQDSEERGDKTNVFTGTTEIGWKSVHGIDPIYGVNLKEKVFQYEKGDYILQYSACPTTRLHREHEHGVYYAETMSKTRVGYFGSDFFICVSKRESEEKAVFVTTFCKCKFCKVPWQNNELFGEQSGRKIEFDALSLRPVKVTLKMQYQDKTRIMVQTFRPGVTNQFDMDNGMDDRNFLSVAYYCSVPLESLHIVPFQGYDKPDLVNSLEPFSIEIIEVTKTVKPIPNMESQQQRTFNTLFDRKDYANVTVVSKDGVPFYCNKSILSVRSLVFERMLANGNFMEGQQGRVQLEENMLAVEAFLKFIYFQDTELETLSLYGLVGTLKLAHLFNFMKLVFAVCWSILEKIKNSEWRDMENLWKLYAFVRHLDTIQVIVRLRIQTTKEIRRLILTKKEQGTPQDKEDLATCINWAFANYGELAKDFTLDIV
ncbi:unnamed protein product [Orchesella dallaii]|uniref:BTB domain-containing protein n=1 Tax=Orchesella dallaii TaxID=48710 RepID=A0ABP1S6H1_9HEXA